MKCSTLFLVGITISYPVMASDYSCTYFGGVMHKSSGGPPSYGHGFGDQPCKKGDVIRIIAYDHAGLGREAMYIADEIADLCDQTVPVTVLGPVSKGNTESGSMQAICTYYGKKRITRK